jgi:hypothetical protein
MSDFRERILSMTNELALDLATEHFRPGRISQMVKNGEITVEEIGEAFTKYLHDIIEDELLEEV